MKPWDIIKQLSETTKRNEKEQILQSVNILLENPKEFWEGCAYAYHPFLTYGVRYLPEEGNRALDKTDYSHAKFIEALEGIDFLNREDIERLRMNTRHEEWYWWYRRIILKDLDCGVTEKTINKVQPGAVKTFDIQLAVNGSDSIDKLSGEYLVDYKLDGVRCLAFVREDEIELRSRSGRTLRNFGHIEKQIYSMVRGYGRNYEENYPDRFVLDGEITSTQFQDLMKEVNRKHDVKVSDAVFNIFDFVEEDAFMNGEYHLSQLNRRLTVDQLFNNRYFSHIKAHPSNRLLLPGERNRLDQLIQAAARDKVEGVMIKPVDEPYLCKKSSNWLKVKPWITVDLEVIGVEEGTKKNRGKLGALVLRGIEDGMLIETNCGSGITDKQRQEFWDNQDKLIGQIVEVKADAITQNEEGGYSLRFPRFVRFRGFDPGEKT